MKDQLELAINETKGNLICIKQTDDLNCHHCCFESTEDCTGIACSDHERKDKKQVIYKIINNTVGVMDYEKLNINYIRGDDECNKNTTPVD